ncbi:hypothetical protein AJ80_04092 [Polytolypa hystricis UAMH7299]|uniref:DNA replication complex GINS protein SLD5 n=1 Tax=Polytolypa hystricis (strain UAMH7299) TaxID=1447883 RepID=A0A2B7YF40_POLH7|nr:hypothetical protein AJ80_04092 [Polytolypa hystricis UAMH7299]
MEIDDILASVDRDHIDLSSPEATAIDHQQLTRFWVTERGAPELLPWPAPLMERVMERVRRQIERIEDLTSSGADASTTLSSNTANTNPTLNLKLSILQSDLSRTQYLLRSFLRQRLAKLTKHSLYYLLLASPPSSSATQSSQLPSSIIPMPTPRTQDPSLLSSQELAFLQAHQSLLSNHYNASFLSSFPPQLRRLDDNAGGTSMVQGPEVKEVVFVRCLGEEVRIVVPIDAPGGVKEELYGRRMRRGEVWVVRWEGVKEAWRKGDVEIL